MNNLEILHKNYPITDFKDLKNITTLAEYKVVHGDDKIYLTISAILIDIAGYFGTKFNDEQIIFIANTIINKGHYLTLQDLALFHRKALEGEFKNRIEIIDNRSYVVKFFKLTPDVLIDWFVFYLCKRGEYFANVSENRHYKIKNEEKAPSNYNPSGLQKVLEIFTRKKINKKPEIKEGTEIKYPLLPVVKKLKLFFQQEFEREMFEEFEKEWAMWDNKKLNREDYIARRYNAFYHGIRKDYKGGDFYKIFNDAADNLINS